MTLSMRLVSERCDVATGGRGAIAASLAGVDIAARRGKAGAQDFLSHVLEPRRSQRGE